MSKSPSERSRTMTNAKDKPAAAAIKGLLSQGPAQELFDNADV